MVNQIAVQDSSWCCCIPAEFSDCDREAARKCIFMAVEPVVCVHRGMLGYDCLKKQEIA